VHGFDELEPYGIGSGFVASAGLRSALAGGGCDDTVAWSGSTAWWRATTGSYLDLGLDLVSNRVWAFLFSYFH
jgi:hypothetical protein